jgi:flagellar basal-body rod protein FlgF
MDHAIYTAMGAASQTLTQQSVTSNNLANASTPGFKAQLMALRAVPVNGPTLETRTAVAASTPGVNSSAGVMSYTGRDLDVALDQDGYLAVQMPDGSEAYTRNGDVQVSSNNQLTVGGYPLMGSGGPISVPAQSQITIGADGTISVLGAGEAPNTLTSIGKLKLVKATTSEMQHGDDGMFHPTDATVQARGATLQDDPTMHLMSKTLEGSNVKPVETMVDMISNARRFEMQMNVIHSLDDNEQRANQLLSLS